MRRVCARRKLDQRRSGADGGRRYESGLAATSQLVETDIDGVGAEQDT